MPLSGHERRGLVITRALRNARLRRVLGAFLIFNVTEWAVWIAVLVWAYDWAGVNGASIFAVAQLVPAAALASPASAWLGRLPKARALAGGYLAQTATYLVLGTCLAMDAPVAVVAVAAALSAVAVTLTRPVHNSLLPQISHTTGDLTVGNAASGTLEAIGIVIGPLACGLLIGPWGSAGVVLLMGVATGIAMIATVRLTTDAPATSPVTPWRGQSRLREVLQDRAARVLSAMVAAESILIGMFDILVVLLALDLLDLSASGPGILSSVFGIGGLLGAGATFLLVGRQRLGVALLGGGLVAGLPFAIAGFAPNFVVAAGLLVLCGAGKAFFEITARTFLQRLLPDRLLTAVFGLQESIMMAGFAVGAIAAPLLVAVVGSKGAFVVAGTFLPAVTIASWALVRKLDASAAVPVDVLELLRAVPILSVLAPRIVERLARESAAVRAPAGTRLVAEGEPGDLFYVIAEGEVRVTRNGDILRRLGAGHWFGELALLRDVPRTATVVCETEVSAWALDRDTFLAAVSASPQSVQRIDDHARDEYR
jgi:hypothetical protein